MFYLLLTPFNYKVCVALQGRQNIGGGMSPRFCIVNQQNPKGVTGYCAAPYGAYILGDTIPTGAEPPPMLSWLDKLFGKK